MEPTSSASIFLSRSSIRSSCLYKYDDQTGGRWMDGYIYSVIE